jgi:hypothetical protein
MVDLFIIIAEEHQLMTSNDATIMENFLMSG